MIGALGSLVFEVSDEKVLTFGGMTREVSGRWTEHEITGGKPKSEYLGPGLQAIELTITLSANLGVRPRAMLQVIEQMVESGAAEWFVVGNRTVGRNPFYLTGSSETWGHIYHGGELARASVSISLKEYV